MKNFCCEDFYQYWDNANLYQRESRMVYPIICIARTVIPLDIEKKTMNVFFIVCGFLMDKPPLISISYCPFCGEDLQKKYQDESHININIEDLNR